MGNSAEAAKYRLRRLSLSEWKDRVDEMLAFGGYRIGNFPDTPWESYYNAGLSAGRVAEVIIGCVKGAERKGSK
jgi:hypothetical protein